MRPGRVEAADTVLSMLQAGGDMEAGRSLGA